jgi:hypothetical protein
MALPINGAKKEPTNRINISHLRMSSTELMTKISMVISFVACYTFNITKNRDLVNPFL